MITSKQNQKIKQVRSLKDKKYRDELGLFVIEGVKLCKEAISLDYELEIFCTPKGQTLLGNVDNQVTLVSEEVFDAMSYEVTPQGVLAVAKKPLKTLFAPTDKCLLLDGVSDPSNVGAIIRTAAASGYTQVYLADCGDAFSPKAVRASMGGIFKVKTYVGTLDQALELIDCPIVVADMAGERFDLVSVKERFCLVIGNEARGVSNKVKNLASYTVSIPMQNGMESLNAAVSAGILMYSLKYTK